MRTLDLNSLFIREFVERSFVSTKHCGHRVLDLGCGTKPYENIYRPCHQFAVAADFDIRTTIDVRLHADALPFPDSTFDTVLMTEVIEHLEAPSAAIAEVARVLGPAGRLFLTWPLYYSLHELPHDYTRFTEFGMAALLQRHGLEVELLRRRGDMIAVLATIVDQFGLGIALAITRLPIIGRLFVPFQWICVTINNLLVLLVYWGTRNARRLHPKCVGHALSGIGHLALWTLGYCVVARKRRSRG